MPPVLCVAVMTFNEAGSLAETLRSIDAAIAATGATAEILIIDDGSTDGSSVIATQAARSDPRMRVIRHETNLGLGEVYRSGFREARGEFLSFLPADGQFPAAVLPGFLERIRDQDLVLGTYRMESHDSLAGRVLTALERTVLHTVFGPFPEFRGVFMVRRRILDGIPLVSTGRAWMVLLEMFIRTSRAGARSVPMETPVLPRTEGRSKVRNLRTVASFLGQIVRLRWRLFLEPKPASNPFKGKKSTQPDP